MNRRQPTFLYSTLKISDFSAQGVRSDSDNNWFSFFFHVIKCMEIVSVHIIFHVLSGVITKIEVRRTRWPWQPRTKTLREAIGNDMIAKMLIKKVQNLISCMHSRPILLEELSLEWNTHKLEKRDEVDFQDLFVTFRCHYIGEEKCPNISCCRNSAPYCTFLWM